MKRRDFFKAVGLLSLSSAIGSEEKTPSKEVEINKVRKCYILPSNRVVDYVGEVYKGGFIGGKIVLDIKEFDGIGYPVVLENYPQPKTYYDFELAHLTEFRNKFTPEMMEEYKQYNNLHSYVRAIRARGDWEKVMSHVL